MGTGCRGFGYPHACCLPSAATLPDEDPLLLKVQEGQLVIGDHAIPCTRDHPELHLVRLPANASLARVLQVAATSTPDEIERSGLSRLVNQAQARRQRLIARASALLGPLGISSEDLDQMVDEHLHSQPRVMHQTQTRYPSLITRVAAILKPFEISADDLDKLVKARLRGHWTEARDDP